MSLVDVHCHLSHKSLYNQLDEVIERAKKAGVARIISSGINTNENRRVLEMAKKYPGVIRPSFGIYPIDALGLSPDEEGLLGQQGKIDIEEEFKFIEQHKDILAGIGEVGLDFKVAPEYKKEQKEIFQRIIEFTERLNKPIIIHSRGAELECIEMLESSRIKKVVLHCFGGRKHIIKRAADKGFYFSIPPVITRLTHFQELVKEVNINQLLTETDSPWLGPVANQTNEPANVIFAVNKIAEIKGFDKLETEHSIFMNYQNVFD